MQFRSWSNYSKGQTLATYSSVCGVVPFCYLSHAADLSLAGNLIIDVHVDQASSEASSVKKKSLFLM